MERKKAFMPVTIAWGLRNNIIKINIILSIPKTRTKQSKLEQVKTENNGNKTQDLINSLLNLFCSIRKVTKVQNIKNRIE